MRFAICVTPPENSALVAAGSEWLRRPCAADMNDVSGVRVSDDLHGLAVGGLVDHGFRAVLTAPFHLRAGASESGLREALSCFAAQYAALPPFPMIVSRHRNYLAIVPERSEAALDAFVSDIHQVIQPWHEDESACRRIEEDLGRTDPDVAFSFERMTAPLRMPRFRFNIALSAILPDTTEKAAALAARARAHFADPLSEPFRIEQFTLLASPGPAYPLQPDTVFKLAD